MDAREPRLWTGAPKRQIGGLAFIQCRPPKVVPLAQQPSFVRVARNSPRVGRTLKQRWWGEAVVARVRLHVPVDYFRVADHLPGIQPEHIRGLCVLHQADR